MRQLIAISCSFLVFSVAIVGTFALVLHMHGELVLTRAGVMQQIEKNGIYGRSVWDDFYGYKLALLEAKPANTISLGSSRAMSVRATLFQDNDHISMGGAIQSVPELEAMARDLKTLATPPQNLLLFVDFEWFLDKTRKPFENRNRDKTESWGHLFQSAFVRLPNLLDSLSAERFDRDPVTGGVLIGSRAKRHGDGFRLDGSIRHYSFLTGRRDWPEPDMADLLGTTDQAWLDQDAHRFARQRGWTGARLDMTLLNRFSRQVQAWADEANTSIILVLPPVAPNAAALLKNGESLPFFPSWRDVLDGLAAQTNITLFDYTDLPLVDPGCWLDRYHASEGGYAWMLARIHEELRKTDHQMAGIFKPDLSMQYPENRDACRKALSL